MTASKLRKGTRTRARQQARSALRYADIGNTEVIFAEEGPMPGDIGAASDPVTRGELRGVLIGAGLFALGFWIGRR